MQKLEKLLPRYAWFPLVTLFVCNFVVYYGSRLFTANFPRLNMALPLDEKLPLCPEFIVFYILAYFQWLVGYICIARESPAHCARILRGEIIAKLICLVCFVALPTTIVRPVVTGNSIFAHLVRLIYRTDLPINLFPSIHCLESWICFRGALGMRRVPHWYAPAMLVVTLLVFASTVLIKQHVLVDIPAGILVGELGLLLSAKLQPNRGISDSNSVQNRPKERSA